MSEIEWTDEQLAVLGHEPTVPALVIAGPGTGKSTTVIAFARAIAADQFVEWLMGLPAGWITDPILELSHAQQLTALGNGVVPGQATSALKSLVGER